MTTGEQAPVCDGLAEVVTTEEARVEDEEAMVEEAPAEEEPEPGQVPKADWQPVPQWPSVDPHQPYCEQQFPKVEPWHVAPPLELPQVPSVETLAVDDGAAELETRVEELETRVDEGGTTADDDATAPPQPNWTLLICHVAVVLEKPDQTTATTALPLAPAKLVKGTVIVWEAPVRPVTVW